MVSPMCRSAVRVKSMYPCSKGVVLSLEQVGEDGPAPAIRFCDQCHMGICIRGP